MCYKHFKYINKSVYWIIPDMTQAKFCDIHNNENRTVPKENTMGIILRKYVPKLKGRTIKRYMELYLDGCNPCITRQILEVAKANGVDTESGWTFQVLVPPKRKGGKWSKPRMTPEELLEFLDSRDAQDAVPEEETEEEQAPRATSKYRTR